MVSISTLRTFVNNGWTIANRRKICTEIGKNNFDEFAKLAKQVGMTGVSRLGKIQQNTKKSWTKTIRRMH